MQRYAFGFLRLWKNRNEGIFRGKNDNPRMVLERTIAQIGDFNRSCENSRMESNYTNLGVLIKSGSVIFVDAARDRNIGETRIGRILVSRADSIWRVWSFAMGVSSSVEVVEASAIRNAMQYCRDCRDLNMICFDAKMVIEAKLG
ncbi:hypothetical protein Syun_027930 [Stephania yunnanensis]|uniref:Uncharacterized protein n=1 Tax=Stephania yunnanensis TaxID=152371 RepID=A0AAP0EGU3_9MAGN